MLIRVLDQVPAGEHGAPAVKQNGTIHHSDHPEDWESKEKFGAQVSESRLWFNGPVWVDFQS